MKITFFFPLIWEIRGESNDCLFSMLKALVDKHNLQSNKRWKQLIRGICLTEKPSAWEKLNEVKLADGWFSSKRDSDMECIGPLIGYYLRCRAEHFCKIIAQCELKPSTSVFDKMNDIFEICDNAIKPAVVELDLPEKSALRFQRFPLWKIKYSQVVR